MSAKQTSTYRHLYFRYVPNTYERKGNVDERSKAVEPQRSLRAEKVFVSRKEMERATITWCGSRRCVYESNKGVRVDCSELELAKRRTMGGDLSNLRSKQRNKVLLCVCDVMTVPYTT